ncbi:hypothetical protein [Thermovibrio sp.]
MKATPLIISLLLTSTAYGFNIKGESAFYWVNLKKNYKRQLGYENWKGRKKGALYKLEIEEKFKVKRGSEFKLSVITNTTKSEYLNLFTPKGERLFSSNPKLFTVKELYLKKEHFLFKNLDLRVGKQEFNLSPLIDDYLWGGHFEYRIGKYKIVWNQIAGYEGRYFLFKGKSEDDIDIFNLNIEGKGKLIGFYLISDARGNEKAVKKTGVLGRLSYKNTELEVATQNGKKAFLISKKVGRGVLEGGYSQKGFTSYGFKEGVRDIGLIFKPTFTDLKFIKLKYRLSPNLTLFALKVKQGGENTGSEIGGEFSYKIGKFYDVFLKASLGSGGSYALFGGLRFSTEKVGKEGLKLKGIKVKNFFSVVGEYTDLPQVSYETQREYEDWSRAKHVGFWHSTYRLQVKGKDFKLKVATGPNNKWDFLIWGNTRDNFIYKYKSGKEWHLEEAYINKGKVKIGLMEVKGEGLFYDSFTGVSFKKNRLKVYLISRKEEKTRKYGLLKISFKKGGVFAFDGAGRATVGIYYGLKSLKAGLLKQKGNWGAFLKLERELLKTKFSADYRVYSKNFKTYSLKEFFWNEGFIFRPGEENIRVLKLKVKRSLNFNKKKLDRLKPALSVYYLRLNRFSGKYVGEEKGVIISLKPGKRCTLNLVGGVGSANSYYEGVYFSVKW